MTAMFVNGSGRNEQYLRRTLQWCFLPNLVHLGKRFQRRRLSRNRPIRNKIACDGLDWDELSNNYRRPSIHASYQVSVHWTKRFQRRICLEIDQSETRIACGGHIFLTYRDQMSIRYRGHSKDATYQMLVYFGKAVSEEKIF